MKILMQMRDNALTHRGGDTVVFERFTEELIKLGHQVVTDLEGNEDPTSFDIAHIYNFATKDKTEKIARRLVERKTKFVVSTMYEDWPSYFNKMIIQELLLSAYVKHGQPQKEWEAFSKAAANSAPSSKQDNTFTALSAQILVSTGFQESVALRRDYPEAGPIEICHFGHQISSFSDGGKLFRKTYDIGPFILCVGRLEQRKNQLSLLKALEDSELTLVFATGGFEYEPNYSTSCKIFKRRGQTIFLDRISSEMLGSAYEAAEIHALPSWYELPGLVSIEAAARGLPCVVSDNGTIRDYLGDYGFYCAPEDPGSIKKSIEEALQIGKKALPKPDLSRFTWENSAKRLLEIYEKAISLPLAQIDPNILSSEKSLDSQELNEILKDNPNLANLIKTIR